VAAVGLTAVHDYETESVFLLAALELADGLLGFGELLG
jgi:hypothetical protein